jgi:hypothetical protein
MFVATCVAVSVAGAQQAPVARARAAVAQANTAAAARGAIPAPAPVRSASPAVAPGTAPAPAPAAPIAPNAVPTTGHAAGAIDSSVAGALSFRREVFAYARGERRDPFVSLMTTGVLRPVVSDLLLVGVAYSPAGGSVAVFRDKQTKEQYRVRAGEPLGRMRVYAIEPKRVTFAIDEFGFNRHESINMGDTTRVSLTQTTTRTGTP